MSDLEKFLALYRSWGIELTVQRNVKDQRRTVSFGADDLTPKLDGFPGFFTELVLDLEGMFIKQGLWE